MYEIEYDVYYDDELKPPSWMVRKYYKTISGMIVVLDAILTEDRKQAEYMLKKIEMETEVSKNGRRKN
jgi:hypothetical protein